jgi:hypothetical protein
MNRRHVVVVLLVALTVANGCSVFELSPEQEEEAYFLRVAQAEAPWLGAIDRFDTTLRSSYSTRTLFMVAIHDAGLVEGARDSLEAAKKLNPPPSLANDHQHWLAFRRAVFDRAPMLTEATTIGDIATILRVRRDLGEAEADLLLSIGRQFCIHLEAVNPAEDCPPDDSLPGGEYGAAAYETLREYAIRVGPLFITSSSLDPSQRSEYLAAVQPNIENLLHTAGTRLRELTPPAEFAADHEALLAYFDDQYATAAAITAANAAGDESEITELYARSAELFEGLQAALTDEIRPIVDPAF